MLVKMEEEKPQCSGGQEEGEYDLPLHVAGLFIVLLASIMGAGFPVVSKKLPWLKVPVSVFFACKHFGTGVLIATAFAHLLPEAFEALTHECLPDVFTEDYPAMAGVIMMAAMFTLFVVEMYLHAKTGGHSHGGPTGTAISQRRSVFIQPQPAPARPPRFDGNSFDVDDEDIEYEKKAARAMFDEKERYPYVNNPFEDPNNAALSSSEMPSWFIVFYEQYVRQRLEIMKMIRASEARNDEKMRTTQTSTLPGPPAITPESNPDQQSYFDAEGQSVDPAVYHKMSANITLLEAGILFHSVFVGITVSLTIEGYAVLLVAIVFHQMFEGLGLGSRIAEVPYPRGSPKPWLLVGAFGTTAPIGMAIGLIVNDSYDPESAFGLIIVGVFNAISSGLLLYAALVDLLAEDFLSEEADRIMTKKDKIQAFCWVIVGAAAMAFIGAFA